MELEEKSRKSRANGAMESLGNLADNLDNVGTPQGGKKKPGKKKVKRKPTKVMPGNSFGISQTNADSALDCSSSRPRLQLKKTNNHRIQNQQTSIPDLKNTKGRRRVYGKRGEGGDYLDTAQKRQNDSTSDRSKERVEFASTVSRKSQSRSYQKQQRNRRPRNEEGLSEFCKHKTYTTGIRRRHYRLSSSEDERDEALSQDENQPLMKKQKFTLESDEDCDDEDISSQQSSSCYGNRLVQSIVGACRGGCTYNRKGKNRRKKSNSKKQQLSASTSTYFEDDHKSSWKSLNQNSQRSQGFEIIDNEIESVCSASLERKTKRTGSGQFLKDLKDEDGKNGKSVGVSVIKSGRETTLEGFIGTAINGLKSIVSPKRKKKCARKTAERQSQSDDRSSGMHNALRRSKRRSKQKHTLNEIIVLSSDEESATDSEMEEEMKGDSAGIGNGDDDWSFMPSDEQNLSEEQMHVASDQSQTLDEKRRSPRLKTRMGGKVKAAATRIAIGSKVLKDSCQINVQPSTKQPYLQIEYSTESPTRTMHKILLDREEIVEIKYFTTDDSPHSRSESSEDDDEKRTSGISNTNKTQVIKSNVSDPSFDENIVTTSEQKMMDTEKFAIEESSNECTSGSSQACSSRIHSEKSMNNPQISMGDRENDIKAVNLQLNKSNTNDAKPKSGSVRKEDMNYLILRIKPTNENGLSALHSFYLSDDKMPSESDNVSKCVKRKRFVVIELPERSEFDPLIKGLSSSDALSPLIASADNEGKLRVHEKEEYIESLYWNMGGNKKKVPSQKRAKFNEDETVLVFPFNATHAELDSAADGLNEANPEKFATIGSELCSATNNKKNKPEEVSATSKTHMVTIRGEDFDRLVPFEFLNDTLIDFWINWITRKTRSNEEKVHVFTTQFFSRLEDEGVEGVTSWTSKKGINIFEKKFIFVPVNKDTHWSLFVIVNPGKVYNVTSKNEGSGAKGESTTDEDELEFPFILFMDSLRAHKKSKMKKHIYNWLNSEAKRLGKFQNLNGNDQPFNSVTTPVADPRVPCQDNSWDCGVFVCRYAYSTLRLYNQIFSSTRSQWTNAGTRKKHMERWISNSPEFQFDMNDIKRLREEMATLIENLSLIYNKKKQQKKQRKLESKRENEGKMKLPDTSSRCIDV